MAGTSERFEFSVVTEKLKSACTASGCTGTMTLRMSQGPGVGFATPGIYESAGGEFVYQSSHAFWYLTCDSGGHVQMYGREEPRRQ